jgi:predicted transcriptional regulator of viral defense system
MKYVGYIRSHFNDLKSPIFTIHELKAVLGLKGISSAYLKRLINYLISSGEILRISKGVYTFHDEITVVGFAFRPFYYGLENALTIRRLWEQGTNPIIITPNNVRRGIRTFRGGNYSVMPIRRNLFFGYDFVQSGGFWIPVSDYEKTVIDFIYFNHYLRRDVLKALRRSIDKGKLASYLKHYNKKINLRVLQELKL